MFWVFRSTGAFSRGHFIYVSDFAQLILILILPHIDSLQSPILQPLDYSPADDEMCAYVCQIHRYPTLQQAPSKYMREIMQILIYEKIIRNDQNNIFSLNLTTRNVLKVKAINFITKTVEFSSLSA